MFHYTECGLNNVWLANGYKAFKTPYGQSVAIEKADALHRAIALSLVRHKPRLSGGEFRFIRKELDLSQAALAGILGNDAQSVARWEKSGRVPKMAERFLRALYREHAEGNAKIREMVERIGQLDRQRPARMVFEETGEGWEPRRAAQGGGDNFAAADVERPIQSTSRLATFAGIKCTITLIPQFHPNSTPKERVMGLEFQSFMIDRIGEMLTVEEDRFAWVHVFISLTDPATNAHPSAEIEVPIQYEDDWTIERVRRVAFDKALVTLQTMCALFEQHGLQGIQQLVAEHEAAEASRLESLRSFEEYPAKEQFRP